MKAYVFNADNTSEGIKPEDEEKGFTLERLQSIVDGTIELVPVKHCKVCGMDGSMVMVDNEDGGRPCRIMAPGRRHGPSSVI